MKIKKLILTNLVLLLFISVFLVFLTQSPVSSIADFSSINNENDSRLSAYDDHGPIDIQNDTALASFSTSGTGASGDPFIIDNYNITHPNSNGITISGITQYATIRDNLIEVSDAGIFLDGVTSGLVSVIDNIVIFCDRGIELSDSPNTLVSGNNCSYSTSIGIYVDYSPHCEIFDNTCDGNWQGIRVYLSNNCTVKGNTVTNGQFGIEIESSESAWIEDNFCSDNVQEAVSLDNGCHYSTITLNYCTNNFQGLLLDSSEELTITRNTCTLNGGEGLYLLNTYLCLVTHNNFSWADTGLLLLYVDNSTLSNNLILNNGFGVYSIRSESNEFHNNLMQDNADYGLGLDSDSHYNTIHHNAFIDNGGASSQADDDGTENTWYEISSSEGNYWSDWVSGTYEIDGMGGNDDLYPLNSIPVISEFLKGNTNIQLIFLLSSLSVLFVLFRRKKK